MLSDYGKQIMHHSKYNGLAEIEFKYDARDSQYKFLEVNPRTWKWHTIAKAAGCNLLLNFYNLTYGRNLTDCEPKDASWTHGLLDVPIRTVMRLKGMEVISKSQNDTMATISLDDPVPALYELLYFPLNVLKRG
jgi:predicted ATP-grasp superfamily ATP-dependent carboligase